MNKDIDYKFYQLSDLVLQCGMTLKNAFLAYKTYGELNKAKDNAIVYPTWFSGQHYENEWLIGPGKALDPAKYFIIVPNMLGNGLSSSPSNTPEPFNGAHFPQITAYDNVMAQKRVIDTFGIKKIKLVTGWSMGANQTYHWAALFPDMVQNILPFQGAAKCSPHNFVFLEGTKAALQADHDYKEGWYGSSPPKKGLRAFGRVYAGWGFSQSFYREKLFQSSMGYASLEDFLVGFWENLFLSRDPNNLLSMLWTWQNSDISNNEIFKGNFQKALSSIKARAIVMPARTDLYFPPEDNVIEVSHMPNAELRIAETIWGHFAGGPCLCQDDFNVLDGALRELIA
jgi:homoserine O-acetyltransferase/O-succinyltransferase